MELTTKQLKGLKIKKYSTPIIFGLSILFFILSIVCIGQWGTSWLYEDYEVNNEIHYLSNAMDDLINASNPRPYDIEQLQETFQNLLNVSAHTSYGQNLLNEFGYAHMDFVNNLTVEDVDYNYLSSMTLSLSDLEYEFDYNNDTYMVRTDQAVSPWFIIFPLVILLSLSWPDFIYIYRKNINEKQYKVLKDMEIVKLAFSVILLVLTLFGLAMSFIDSPSAVWFALFTTLVAIGFVTITSIVFKNLKTKKPKVELVVQNPQVQSESKNDFANSYLPALKLARIGAIVAIVLGATLFFVTFVFGIISMIAGSIMVGFFQILLGLIVLAWSIAGPLVLMSMIGKSITTQQVKSQVSLSVMCLLFGSIFGLIAVPSILSAEK